MSLYTAMNKEQLQQEYQTVRTHFDACKAQQLKLNMARGKPAKAQLDLVSDILNVVVSKEDCIVDGVDIRNYGELSGLKCAKEYWADVLDCKSENIFLGGTASLNLMFDVISRAFTHGLLHSERPWCKEEKVKFLCPSPGYDRHFRITEFFGAELITVPMTDNGPDMDVVEQLVADPQVKGIWCVPKYSNPSGAVYSDAVIQRFAALKPAAKDFKIMWDNAYVVHHLTDEEIEILDIFEEAKKHDNEDMIFMFASTSKITYPGAGVACMVASEKNMKWAKKLLGVQAIGPDKINQARHVKFFGNAEGVKAHMKKHAAILAPKFQMVVDMLEQNLQGIGATWLTPKGGYFVSFDLPGCASHIFELCKNAGLVMTDAGATWPLGKDPQDSNLRIAPSLPPVSELKDAMEVFCICAKLAAVEKALA